MPNQMELAAKSAGAEFEPTRTIFDLWRGAREVFDLVTRQVPQVQEAFDALQARIPFPRSAVPSIQGRFYRLPGHNRSFCYALGSSDSIVESPVLVFKGAEPLMDDFATTLDWMAQAPL